MTPDARAIAFFDLDTDRILGFFSVNGLMATQVQNARVYPDGDVPRHDFELAGRLLVRPHPFDHVARVQPRVVHWEN